jgi:His/Glu/Gln/Arg/opine family amino acid ABC transporter permease subunit
VEFDFSLVRDIAPRLLDGLVLTLELSAWSIVIGGTIGIAMGLFRVSGVLPVLQWIVKGYVYFMRGTPLLVQIYIVFFLLPRMGLTLNPYWTGVAALSAHLAAYVTEICRSAIESIPRGQGEAAISVGLTRFQTLTIVQLPQAAKRMIPPLTNELASTIKNTSLLSVIAVFELTKAGNSIIQREFIFFEVFFVVALYYLIVVQLVTTLANYLERRVFT